MKKIISIVMVLCLTVNIFGQRREKENGRNEIYTLFGNNRFSSGGYGGFGAGYTIIDGKDAITTNGRAAWIIGHSLGIGIAGTGFVNDFHYDAFLGDDVNLAGGYGGILIEPILFGRSPIHIAFPMVAGLGGIAYTRSSNWTGDPWNYTESWVEDTDTYLIFEPGVEIELNILKFFRIAGGISYRKTSEIRLIENDPGLIAPDVLEGFNVGITFKFGKF